MKYLIIVVSLLLAACSSSPTRLEIDNAYFEKAATYKEIQEALRLQLDLFDPYSAVILCFGGIKGYHRYDNVNHFGWIHLCQINAKNKFGGYTGVRDYYVFNYYGKVYPLQSHMRFGVL